MTVWDKVVKALAGIGGGIAGLFGGFDVMLGVLVGVMAVDYATGLIVAAMGNSPKTETGHLDSKAGFKGLLRKGVILLMVMLGAMLDMAMGNDTAMFRGMVIWFYVANEGISILENVALTGVPFPAWLKGALEQLRDREPGGEGKAA